MKFSEADKEPPQEIAVSKPKETSVEMVSEARAKAPASKAKRQMRKVEVALPKKGEAASTER